MLTHRRKVIIAIFTALFFTFSQCSYAQRDPLSNNHGGVYTAIICATGFVLGALATILSKLWGGKPKPDSLNNFLEESLEEKRSLEKESYVPIGTTHIISVKGSKSKTPEKFKFSYKLHNNSNSDIDITKIGLCECLNSNVKDNILNDNYDTSYGNITITHVNFNSGMNEPLKSQDPYHLDPFTLHPNEIHTFEIDMLVNQDDLSQLERNSSSVLKKHKCLYVEAKTVKEDAHRKKTVIKHEPITIPFQFNVNYSKIDIDPLPKEINVIIGQEATPITYKIKNSGTANIDNLVINIIGQEGRGILRQEDNASSNSNDDNKVCGGSLKAAESCKIKLATDSTEEITEKNAIYEMVIYDNKEELARYPLKIKPQRFDFEISKKSMFSRHISFDSSNDTVNPADNSLEYQVTNTGDIDIEVDVTAPGKHFKEEEVESSCKATKNTPLSKKESCNVKFKLAHSNKPQTISEKVTIFVKSPKNSGYSVAKTMEEDYQIIVTEGINFTLKRHAIKRLMDISDKNEPLVDISNENEPLELIGTTGLIKQEIEYLLESTATIKSIEVNDVSNQLPIKIESIVKYDNGNNDGNSKNHIASDPSDLNLPPGLYLLKLGMRPIKAGKFLHELRFAAKDYNGKEKTVVDKIEINAIYKPHVLITKDMINEDVRKQLGNFEFTMPMLSIDLDEEATEFTPLFIGTDKGLLARRVVDGAARWNMVNNNDKKIVDMHIVGNNIYYISGRYICSNYAEQVFFGEGNKIKISCDNGISWKSLDADYINGIHQIGNKVFVANSHSISGTGVGVIQNICSNPYIESLDAEADGFGKITGFKVYGENTTICTFLSMAIFISTDMGKNWRTFLTHNDDNFYSLWINGYVQTINCREGKIIIGTGKYLKFSRNNGMDWVGLHNAYDQNKPLQYLGNDIRGVYLEDDKIWIAIKQKYESYGTSLYYLNYEDIPIKNDSAIDIQDKLKPHKENQKVNLGDYTMVFFPGHEKLDILSAKEIESLLSEYKEKRLNKDITSEEKEKMARKFYNYFIFYGKRGDFYKIFGVADFTDQSTIKKRYNYLAQILHPDKARALSTETLDLAENAMAYISKLYKQMVKIKSD